MSSSSVALGCYQKDKQRIFAVNYGISGGASIIYGDDLNKLFSATKDKPVELQFWKELSTSEGGEVLIDSCYSLFRSFKVL